MGAQLHAQLGGGIAHQRDVAIEDIDVDEERGRGNIGSPHR